MTSDSLAARVYRAIDEFPFYAGGERFEAQGAVFVRNRSIPDKYYANHVEQVSASTPEEIARLSARIEVEFEGYRHRCFYVDRDTPAEFEAWLVMEGYQRTDSLVMVLTEELPRHTQITQDCPRRDRLPLAGTVRTYRPCGPGVRKQPSGSRQQTCVERARRAGRRPAIGLPARPVLAGIRRGRTESLLFVVEE